MYLNEENLHCMQTNQYTTSQVREEKQSSIVEQSKAAATEASVQVDQQVLPQLMAVDQQKQEQAGLSCGTASQQLGPSAPVGRLPLTKLKTYARSKSNSEQEVEKTLAEDIEGTSSQLQQREDFTSTTSSYSGTTSIQAENVVGISSRVSSPRVVQADIDHVKLGGKSLPKLNLRGRMLPQLMAVDQQKQEQAGLSCGTASQYLGPSAPVGRPPLPKLKTYTRSKSNLEQEVEKTLADNIEGTASQKQQRNDFTSTTSSYSGAPSTQAENMVNISFRAASPRVVQADIENNPDHIKLDRKSLPKLNIFGRSTSTMSKNVVERQENVEKKHKQCSSTALFATNEENLVTDDNMTNMKPDQRVCPQQRCAGGGISQQGISQLALPPLEVEQGIPSEVEHVASKALDGKSQMEVSHSHNANQQAHASAPPHADQFNRREVAGQHGGAACDHEEEGFFDAECGNLHASEKVDGGENEVDDERTLEALLPSASSPHTTPGVILILRGITLHFYCPAKRRLPPLKLSPGTALNDRKREAAMKEMLDRISQEENCAVPSLPKAPRLHLSSQVLSPVEKTCPEGHISPKERTSVQIPFNIAELAQDGALKSAASEVTSPPSANQVGQEASSTSRDWDIFGGGDAGFSFNFDADESKDTSFSFFDFDFDATGGCKSPEQEEKGGEEFFLNFGGGDIFEAPRLQLSPEKSCPDGDLSLKERRSPSIPFDAAQLENLDH